MPTDKSLKMERGLPIWNYKETPCDLINSFSHPSGGFLYCGMMFYAEKALN
jgi:hypothetical protein